MPNNCLECQQVITNPICSGCLTKTMSMWLQEKKPELAQNLELDDAQGDTLCLFCSRGMSICAHCTSRDVYDYLAEIDMTIAKEFAARFDFELRADVFAY